MDNYQKQSSSNKVKIQRGKITPPPVQRPKTDKTQTNSHEK